MEQSPLAIYQAHLDKGELAYQWSPEAGRAVFYPRLVCPYSGSASLEWRVASGLGRVYVSNIDLARPSLVVLDAATLALMDDITLPVSPRFALAVDPAAGIIVTGVAEPGAEKRAIQRNR